MSVGDKEPLLLNILISVLCQFELCAKIRSQAVSVSVFVPESIRDTRSILLSQ